MKKPMKFKRYDEGGEVADKEAGLKASKDEDVGFFQRLRMGNIDDPSSEAYKRFGAGRGRSERTPVSEAVSVSGSQPVARPSMRPNPIFAAGVEQGKTKGSGDAYMAEYYAKKERSPEAIQEADNPRVSSPASKPTASASKPAASKPSTPKPSKPSSKSRDDDAMMEADNPAGSRSMVGVPGTLDKRGITSETRAPRFTPNEPPVGYGRRDEENQTKAPIDETKLSLSERMKLSRERSKSGSGPTDRRSVSERIRSSMGMKSGGSVSSASRRADGIATKGKTRGKIC